MPTPPTPTGIAGAPTSTLAAIQTKVRRLTRSISENQLSTTDLNNYINTFVVYDFPEQLRTFNLRTTFTWWCNAYQDVYPTDTSVLPVPALGQEFQSLYNFQNMYISVHPPVYVAGFQSFYTQSPQQFWGIYPFTNSIAQIASTGNGTVGPFVGVINTNQSIIIPGQTQSIVLDKKNVLFSSVDVNNNGLSMVDTPISNTIGNLAPPGVAPFSTTIVDPNNNINYLTGAYTLNFPTATLVGAPINSQTVNLTPARPQAVMYYANSFTLRPIPDQPYAINLEVYQRPTALLSSGQSPELEEYWQLIAYGAAIKVLQDRMDMETVDLLRSEFDLQLRLCLRRTIVQYTNERTATIYTENTSGTSGYWGNGFGGGSF